MKTITICGKEYPIDCNAFTQIEYRKFFKAGMVNDAHVIQNYIVKQIIVSNEVAKEDLTDEERISRVSDYMVGDVDEFLIKILQITWILIHTADNKIEEYEKWAKSFKVRADDDWIAEVAEFAVNCFC